MFFEPAARHPELLAEANHGIPVRLPDRSNAFASRYAVLRPTRNTAAASSNVKKSGGVVVGGQLPGQRFGNVWVVPKDAVAARRHSPGLQGRPLGPVKAWHEILAGSIDLRHPGRYRRRANIIRCEMSRADVVALPEMVGAMLGGVRAAIDLGEQLALDDNVDLYLSAKSFAGLDERVALVSDAAGRISLRVVDDEAWQLLPKGALAPQAAVALDLLESGDPRHWISAEHLVEGAG